MPGRPRSAARRSAPAGTPSALLRVHLGERPAPAVARRTRSGTRCDTSACRPRRRSGWSRSRRPGRPRPPTPRSSPPTRPGRPCSPASRRRWRRGRRAGRPTGGSGSWRRRRTGRRSHPARSCARPRRRLASQRLASSCVIANLTVVSFEPSCNLSHGFIPVTSPGGPKLAMKRAPTVTSPTDAALERAAVIAREFLAGLPDRPGRADGLRSTSCGGASAARCRTRARDPVEVVESPGGQRRGRPRRERRAALLRVRDRRRPAGGAGRGLADERLGPERRAVRDRPGRGGRRGGRRRLARGAVRAARPASASGSRPARRWRRSPGSPPAATRCCARAGWDVERQGLFGAPEIPVVVSDESHVTIFAALQMLGMGRERVIRVATDDQGRMRADALREALAGARPAGAGLRAGRQRQHRRLRPAAARSSTRSAPTAAGSTSTARSGCGRRPTRRGGTSSRASGTPTRGRPTPTSGSTCPTTRGSRSCADPAAHHAAMTLGAAYYVETTGGERDAYNWVPESSRRARGFAVWAALRQLGRTGVAEMIGRTLRPRPAVRGGPRRRARCPDPQRRRAQPGARPVRGPVRRRRRPATPGRTP